MESERAATAASAALYPPPSPQELAEASKTQSDTDSNTLAGVQRLLFLSCQENKDLAKRYVEDSRNYYRDVQNLAATVLELNKTASEMIRDYRASMEAARKPIQPRPTAAETVGSSVNHIVTELRRSVQVAFGQDPELREKAQQGLETVVEKGKGFISAVVSQQAPPATATAKTEPEPVPGSPASNGPGPVSDAQPTRAEIVEWMDAVGMPFVEKLFARHGCTVPEDMKGPVLADLKAAYLLAVGS